MTSHPEARVDSRVKSPVDNYIQSTQLVSSDIATLTCCPPYPSSTTSRSDNTARFQHNVF
ncbi:hypothetical protein BGX38DRAFT_617547 [Terfezia claveryi]|nr:hypothetical protein BGX38DRAFT_617547 [Terfezia claveryi]